MEKKRLVLIFSALCLALACSVSSVEAQQDKCEPCGSCDQDGDLLISNKTNCRRACEAPLGIDVDDTEPSDGVNRCEPESEVFNLYEVTLIGPVTGGPTTWEDKTSGDGWIGTPVHNPGRMALDLSFFQAIEGGGVCFPNDDGDGMMTLLGGAQLIVKQIKGGGDLLQATGLFYFEGNTSDPDIFASYVLELLGMIDDPAAWPGTQDIPVTDWVMKVNTTTKGGRKIACTSEGLFVDPSTGARLDETISVFQTQ